MDTHMSPRTDMGYDCEYGPKEKVSLNHFKEVVFGGRGGDVVGRENRNGKELLPNKKLAAEQVGTKRIWRTRGSAIRKFRRKWKLDR